jgi:hypothetical protein
MRPGEPRQLNPLQTYRPTCPRCGACTMLTCIEPADTPDHDLRTFRCETCGHAELMEIKFR